MSITKSFPARKTFLSQRGKVDATGKAFEMNRGGEGFPSGGHFGAFGIWESLRVRS
jgi:hypothetical protein